ncbi:hypothetical protein AWR38_06185 [Idiomarina sp. WRN-38]|nr:hypothetical protein AUR68_06170 [Idiomarina sp. H105]OAE91005.1 hypothetical protein AWR38_06185 [Idiomarina sp. WRN-38]
MPIHYFNTQLKPMDIQKYGFVGDSGYKELFTALKARVEELKESKTLHQNGVRIKNSTSRLVFEKVVVEEDYAWGRIKKYMPVDKVEDFYTDEELYSATGKKTGVSSKSDYDFVFQYSKHTLAINGSALPKPVSFEEVIILLLEPPSYLKFPNHTLSCNVLTERTAAQPLYAAESVRKVHVELTFSNPNDALNDLEKEIESDIREHGIDKYEVKESAASGNYMSGLRDRTKALVSLATRWGKASAKYLGNDNKLKNYFSVDNPVRHTVRRTKAMTESDFLNKMKNSIAEAWQQASGNRNND